MILFAFVAVVALLVVFGFGVVIDAFRLLQYYRLERRLYDPKEPNWGYRVKRKDVLRSLSWPLRLSFLPWYDVHPSDVSWNDLRELKSELMAQKLESLVTRATQTRAAHAA